MVFLRDKGLGLDVQDFMRTVHHPQSLKLLNALLELNFWRVVIGSASMPENNSRSGILQGCLYQPVSSANSAVDLACHSAAC